MKNKIILSIMSIAAFVAIISCAIVNKAIAGTLTWSIIPISSIIFVYIVLFPLIGLKKSKILYSLIMLTILIVPYLYVLNTFIDNDMFISLGIKSSVIVAIYLWIIFAVFKIFKNQKLLITSIIFLLAIPVYLLINFIVPNNKIDIWDFISLIMLFITAIICFVFNHLVTKRLKK